MPPQPDRDPRTEPRAGDVLQARGQRRRVKDVSGVVVEVELPNETAMVVSMRSFRRWAKTAKVVSRGS